MSSENTVSMSSIIVASQEQRSSDLTGETVILNLKSGMYYGLSAVGVSIWNLIQEPKAVSEVRDGILAKYDVEPEQCDRDVLALLEELATEGLIEVRDAAVA
ncbi:MAG: lasso peptide biosynthesis PqqD family chaperone [Coleofasciculus sp. B1-GNL1-01]|uniref:lasso peptide biosynthesis PqqD family chaperone n=1 Tax=Coleofasciculus sp. B1-GNL1-01 TaxID=3068484 RepID=UPI0032FAC8E9